MRQSGYSLFKFLRYRSVKFITKIFDCEAISVENDGRFVIWELSFRFSVTVGRYAFGLKTELLENGRVETTYLHPHQF